MELAALADALCAEPVPEWMTTYLGDLVARLASADLSALGVQRERFKRERLDVLDALRAAVALARGLVGWERVVSERIFGDSKRLASVRPLVVEVLLRADPRWEGFSRDDAPDLLEAYGVRRKPALLRCAGRAHLKVGPRIYELEDFTPAAHLPGAWAGAWVDAVVAGPTGRITTIENETASLPADCTATARNATARANGSDGRPGILCSCALPPPRFAISSSSAAAMRTCRCSGAGPWRRCRASA